MAHKTPFWFQVTTIVGALSAGCAAHPALPETASAKTIDCPGGTIANRSDAARFSVCSAVVGNLTIARSSLRDLTSLRSLSSVSGTLTISDNAHLKSLRGLEHLSSAREVKVTANPELQTLEGLDGLSSLENLEIRNNGIHSTSGLEGLRDVAHLTVADNRYLISLAGLSQLERVSTAVVERNPLLCAQFGLFDSLSEVEKELSVKSNYGISASERARLYGRVGQPASPQPNAAEREYARLD